MTKLCARGKAAAKRKFKVYPSAYANAYASKICAGKIKDPSGVKRKDFKGPKPANKGLHAETKKKRSVEGDPNKRRKQLKDIQNPNSEYDKKGNLKYTFANKGKEIKIKKVAKALHKASGLHKKQANTLESIKANTGKFVEYKGKFIKHDSAGIKMSNESLVNYYGDLLK